MSTLLTEQIIKHILSSLGVINSDKNIRSLIDNNFLLSEKLSFQMEDDSIVNNKIWGCQFTIDKQEFKLMLGDASQDKNIKEYCLIVHLHNMPTYGIYFINDIDSQPLIAVTIDKDKWMACSIYLQATFLAGMEQIKNYGFSPQKCLDYKSEYELMLSFINYHTSVYEGNNEG